MALIPSVKVIETLKPNLREYRKPSTLMKYFVYEKNDILHFRMQILQSFLWFKLQRYNSHRLMGSCSANIKVITITQLAL